MSFPTYNPGFRWSRCKADLFDEGYGVAQGNLVGVYDFT